MKNPICFLLPAAILAALASCATSVAFDVEHPPLVDLRGIHSITIIPFEKNSSGNYEYLSAYVTSALTKGIQSGIARGNIIFIEPLAVENVPERNMGQYVDAYLTGKITSITPIIAGRTNNRAAGNQINRMDTVTCTVIVDIEYSYIRAKDGVILETFRKREDYSENINFERNRFDSRVWNNYGNDDHRRPGGPAGPALNPGWYDPGLFDRRQRRGGYPGMFIAGSWGESLAKYAINRFSFTMSRELAPWTTAETRILRKKTGKESAPEEAGKLIRKNNYNQALGIYQETYKQNGTAAAGYNNAILLAANRKFSDALELLENLSGKLRASGQKNPRYIKKEIQKMTEIVNNLKILEDYKTSRNTAAPDIAQTAGTGANTPGPPASAPKPPADRSDAINTRQIRGTINSNSATVYALREAIASADDASVWTKIIASAEAISADPNALGGEWSLGIPSAAPPMLWFAVTDSHSGLYITQKALSTAGIIVLDTAQMIRLK